jgi:YfiH family protein
VAVGRQVHGSTVVTLRRSPERGVHVAGEADGMTTAQDGVLLAVTVADCVPVYLAGPAGRAVGLVHAGWRGAAAGVLETAIEAMARSHGVDPSRLCVHLGPAICGSCYGVGSEVFAALGIDDREPGGLDLRGVLADRALRAGVTTERLTCSSHCTRCDSALLFSHRRQGRRAGRMAAFLGRSAPPAIGPYP